MRLKTVGLGLSLFLLTLPLMNSCSKNVDTSAPDQNEPVEIISVYFSTGASQFPPPEPLIKITLKNVSDKPIIALSATIDTPDFGTVIWDFNVSSSNPLMPGNMVDASHFILGYWLNSNSFSLNITGTVKNGSIFEDTQVVSVSWPPEPSVSSDNLTLSTATSANGLGLTLSISSIAYKAGDKVSITLDERNTLLMENNVLRADAWAFQGLTLGPCGTLGFPFGVVILQGNYDATNIASVTPLQSLYDPNGIYLCPPPPDFISYDFQPSSDVASLVPTPPSNYEAVPSSMTSTVASAVFWTGSPKATFSNFTPGTYTVVGGDEWGAIAILHFTVS